jgi:hypothetical protein
VIATLPCATLVSSPAASSSYRSTTKPRLPAIARKNSMWQLDSAATSASSGSTASSADIGSGTDEGADDAGTSTPPSKRQVWRRLYLPSRKVP